MRVSNLASAPEMICVSIERAGQYSPNQVLTHAARAAAKHPGAARAKEPGQGNT